MHVISRVETLVQLINCVVLYMANSKKNKNLMTTIDLDYNHIEFKHFQTNT